MQFYIACGLKNIAQHNAVRDALRAEHGHRITYDWTIHGAVRRTEPGGESRHARLTEVAGLEATGVRQAAYVVVLLPSGLLSSGRGTHVELGMALALDIPVIAWTDDQALFSDGPETCAFYHDPCVTRVVGIDAPADVARAIGELLGEML